MATSDALSFGELLRQHRERSGMTQEELAALAGLSAQAIGALERGDRKRPYPHTIHALALALKLSEQDEARMHGLARRKTSALEPAGAQSLPTRVFVPPTVVYGRNQARHDVAAMLRRDDLRIVTMTGPGGVGKTRLASEIATELDGQFPDSVVSVSLIQVSDSRQVLATIAEALGVRDNLDRSFGDALRAFLKHKNMLLLLDNLEHLLDAAPDLAALLADCPDLKMLVTSRAPLRLRGEQEFPVLPLSIPADPKETATADQASDFPAIMLFVSRAQEVDPTFSLTDDNVADIAEICRRLDGLPLAIELAAARIRLFPPRALRGRLTNRLALLTGGARDLPDRQRTMRDAIAWSYDLCTRNEQDLFARLSVFPSSATIDAIHAVWADSVSNPDGPIDLLASLISSNMVFQVRSADGESRYGMLETIREFGREQLEARGIGDQVQLAHATYFASRAATAGLHEYSSRQSVAILEIEPDIDNIRAAMSWLLEDERAGTNLAQLGLQMAGDLVRFCDIRGHLVEERRWLTLALERAPQTPSPARAFALASLGVTYWFEDDMVTSADLQNQAIAMSRKLDDPLGLVRSVWFMGLVAIKRGDAPRVLELIDELEALLLRVGTTPWKPTPNYLRGFLCLGGGDAKGAKACFSEAIAYVKAHDVAWSYAWISEQMAQAEKMEGNFPEVLRLYRQSLAGWHTLGDRYGMLDAIIGIAVESLRSGNLTLASQLLGAESTWRVVIGQRVTWAAVDIEGIRNEAREAAGGKEFEAAFAEGAQLSLDDAVELALALGS